MPMRLTLPILALLLGAVTACDDAPQGAQVEVRAKGAKAASGGPVVTCTKAGQRCKLSGNKLGICTVAEFKSEDPAKSPEGPGFVCLSQH